MHLIIIKYLIQPFNPSVILITVKMSTRQRCYCRTFNELLLYLRLLGFFPLEWTKHPVQTHCQYKISLFWTLYSIMFTIFEWYYRGVFFEVFTLRKDYRGISDHVAKWACLVTNTMFLTGTLQKRAVLCDVCNRCAYLFNRLCPKNQNYLRINAWVGIFIHLGIVSFSFAFTRTVKFLWGRVDTYIHGDLINVVILSRMYCVWPSYAVFLGQAILAIASCHRTVIFCAMNYQISHPIPKTETDCSDIYVTKMHGMLPIHECSGIDSHKDYLPILIQTLPTEKILEHLRLDYQKTAVLYRNFFSVGGIMIAITLFMDSVCNFIDGIFVLVTVFLRPDGETVEEVMLFCIDRVFLMHIKVVLSIFMAYCGYVVIFQVKNLHIIVEIVYNDFD